MIRMKPNYLTWGTGVLCLLLIKLYAVNAELFTALNDMEVLVDTEAVLLRSLEGYINTTEQSLQQLKRIMTNYAKEHEEASNDISNYLSNPINAFLLVKRLTVDWKRAESLMFNFTEEIRQNITQYKQILKFPTDEDLTGTAIGLMRLQDTYNLETSALAQGELNGIQYNKSLSAEDCFEIGRQSYDDRDFYHTVLWMTEALKRHEREQNSSSTEKWEILEYLAFSTYMRGNIRRALEITDELLAIIPDHEIALDNKMFYQAEIEKSEKVGLEMSQNNVTADEKMSEKERFYVSMISTYEKLCRNEINVPHNISAHLKCRYVHKDIPFLRIAPLKEEEAYLKPRIVMYRNVMSDNEIEVIKILAQTRLVRANVSNYNTGESEVADYRTGKLVWMADEEHEVIARISRRIEDMTSLTLSTAEELQVLNYGIGGHYEPHFDFSREQAPNPFKNMGRGNRIATVLIYMSDVAQGGATVFPNLNVVVMPEKGTAVFWYNLHPSGEGDYNSRHGACPVLAGSKWVCNKWIHEFGQEFRRPCSLEHEVSPFEL